MIVSETLAISSAEGATRERVRYFSGQLITADDMRSEQEYFRQKLRRHNRYLHGWGVVCGCEVKPNHDKDHPWQVRVCPGYLITPQGDEICIPGPVDFDFAGDWRQAQDPCACSSSYTLPRIPKGEQPQRVYLVACYAECSSRPVRVHPVGCACDEAACEYSRIRDSFELAQMFDLPESHIKAEVADLRWKEKFKVWVESPDRSKLPPPLPCCPEMYDDNCVVLASFVLPESQSAEIVDDAQIYNHRRVLYSNSTLDAIKQEYHKP
jgi:hypothetical protein